MTGQELDRGTLKEINGLDERPASWVAKHLVMAGVVAVTATDVLAAVPVTGAAPAGLTRTGGAARARMAGGPSAAVRRRALVARTAPNDPRTIPVTSELSLIHI